jgi:hypothetical protein
MLPYSILPFVLGCSFLVTWAYVVWLEYKVNVDEARRDGEAPSGVVYFGGGSVGRTRNAAERPAVKQETHRPKPRVAARSTPVALRASYGTGSRTLPLPKREGNTSLRRAVR